MDCTLGIRTDCDSSNNIWIDYDDYNGETKRINSSFDFIRVGIFNDDSYGNDLWNEPAIFNTRAEEPFLERTIWKMVADGQADTPYYRRTSGEHAGFIAVFLLNHTEIGTKLEGLDK
jgi:hypothetical protein